jgi:phosphoglycerate dehydrogenase-like enzyme
MEGSIITGQLTRPHVVVLAGGLMGDGPKLGRLRNLADFSVIRSPEELAKQIPTADVVFVWDYRFAELGNLLHTAPRLRWVHVAGVGVDKVLSPELKASDIVLTNSRGVFDTAIAEYVTMLLLAHAKKLRETLGFQAERNWCYRETDRIAGRAVAIVGTGSIGRCIAKMLSALNLVITLVGRVSAEDAEFGLIRPSSELAQVAKEVDYLVLAAPLTNETRGLVDRKVLESLGPNGYLVNVGRGTLVVTRDLTDALATQRIGGAALDVFEIEPLPTNSPLWDMAEVIISPHMSGDYVGFEEALLDVFAENLGRHIAGTELRNIVDPSRGYVPSV